MDKPDKPLVHIIILNWNAEVVTAECLQSIRHLTYPNYHVILVDNHSLDRSGDRLSKQFPEVTFIPLDSNLGFTGGNNVGIRKALEDGSDYILLLNNDTVVAPDLLDRLVEVSAGDPAIAVVSPKILFFDQPDRIWYAAGSFSWWSGMPSYYYKKKEGIPPKQLTDVTFATGCAMLLKAQAIKEVGLLDERFFFYGEDTDLTTRILKAGYRALYTPHTKVWHRDNYTVGKYKGVAFKVFLSTRNKFLLMLKHATFWHWITFLPNFLVRHILFFILLGFWRGNLNLAWAPLKGCRAFFRKSFGDPHISGEFK